MCACGNPLFDRSIEYIQHYVFPKTNNNYDEPYNNVKGHEIFFKSDKIISMNYFFKRLLFIVLIVKN